MIHLADNEQQYETLLGFYERSYSKLSAAGIPMIFHPGEQTIQIKHQGVVLKSLCRLSRRECSGIVGGLHRWQRSKPGRSLLQYAKLDKCADSRHRFLRSIRILDEERPFRMAAAVDKLTLISLSNKSALLQMVTATTECQFPSQSGVLCLKSATTSISTLAFTKRRQRHGRSQAGPCSGTTESTRARWTMSQTTYAFSRLLGQGLPR